MEQREREPTANAFETYSRWYGNQSANRAFPPHPPEDAPAVGAGRFGRGEVSEGRKVTSDLFVSNRADRIHSVLGVFGFFCAARGPGRWFFSYGLTPFHGRY